MCIRDRLGIHWEGSNLGFSIVHKRGLINYYSGIVNGKVTAHNRVIQDIINDKEFPFRETTFKLDCQANGIGYFLQLTFVSSSQLHFLASDFQISHLGLTFDIPKIRKLLSKKNQ